MKIAIITILDNTNYGTFLQALATGLTIQKLGYDVEVIRYTRPFMTPEGHSKLFLKEHGLLKWLYRCKLIGMERVWQLRERNFSFIKKYIKVTPEYVGFDSLLNNPPIADVYLTGSDQVWNSVYNKGIDRSFYLDFAPAGCKRIAYGASIGMDSIPSKEIEETRLLLEKYAHITVREYEASILLNNLGISTEVVLDPTLLLKQDDWSRLVKDLHFISSEPYLLVYCVEKKEQRSLIEYYAKRLAKEKNLKIYAISYRDARKEFPWADRWFSYATPEEFLSLMSNSEFNVVSSFHGTVFSVIFNKPFITISANRFNSRVNHLLTKINLDYLIVNDKSFNFKKLEGLRYMDVNKRLESLRKQSLMILMEMIGY